MNAFIRDIFLIGFLCLNTFVLISISIDISNIVDFIKDINFVQEVDPESLKEVEIKEKEK